MEIEVIKIEHFENFRKEEIYEPVGVPLLMSIPRSLNDIEKIKVMHYFVGVFSIQRNRVANYTRFELDDKIMCPGNINEYMDGIDTLVDQIVLHFYSCGNPDTKHFEYIKDRY